MSQMNADKPLDLICVHLRHLRIVSTSCGPSSFPPIQVSLPAGPAPAPAIPQERLVLSPPLPLHTHRGPPLPAQPASCWCRQTLHLRSPFDSSSRRHSC